MRYSVNMKLIKDIFLVGLLAFTLALVSCSNPVYPPKNEPTANQQEDEGELPPIVDEMSYNYVHLKVYYVYAEEELRPYSGYAGRGKNIPYGDVLAMYADLSDRWTNYWTPADAPSILAQLTTSGAEQKLVGMHLRVEQIAAADQPDELYVDRVWVGSPAEASGALKGDRIITVNGYDLTTDPTLKGDALLLRYAEKADSVTVSFTMLRNGANVSIGPITKKTMRPPTVFLDYVGEIPVVQITGFSEDSGYDETAPDKKSNTIKELRAALTRISENGAPPVGIIDLRGNPGGSVNQCFASIDELVAVGIYSRYEEHYYDGQKPVIDLGAKEATPGGLGEAMDWIFLADANSASAAEILLYGVKNCRPETRIFGTKTYGKGVGQYYFETALAHGLAGITAMKFYDKNWNTYHGIGIAPDVSVNSAGALEAAVTSLSPSPQVRSVLGAPPADRAAIRALNDLLIEQQVPSDGIRGGAWKLLPVGGVH
jgi:C-terminal processing protease CtpA/Prc